MKKTILLLVFTLAFGSMAFAGDYDFDWKGKNDMRGAFMMCATVGFTLGECPDVFIKCWQPPLIWFKRHKSHYHVKTECVKMPNFFVNSSDVDDILADAWEVAGEGGMSVDAMTRGVPDH